MLIRAKTDREVEGVTTRLLQTVDEQPVAGIMEVELPRQHGRKTRTAKLAIRYITLTLSSPQSTRHLPAVEVQVVHAQEQAGAHAVDPSD